MSRPRAPTGVLVPSPPARLRASLVIAGAIAAGVLALSLLLLWTPVLPDPARSITVGLLLVALAVTVTVTCFLAARRSTGYSLRVLRLLAATALCWSVGEILRLYNRGLTSHPFHPMVAGVWFLVALVPITLALTSIPAGARSPAERLRVLLGSCIVVASVLLFIRTLILNAPFVPSSEPVPVRVVQAFFPIADAALACLVWVVLLRVGTRVRLPLLLVSMGLLAHLWVDFNFAYQGGDGRAHSETILDSGSVVCYLLLILAALSTKGPELHHLAKLRTRGRYVGIHSLLVYIPVLVASVAANAAPRTYDGVVIVSGLLVLILFGVRQVVMSVDNSRLHDDLEGRVDDLMRRSSELRRLGLQNERIVESVVDGVIGVDAHGAVIFVNTAAARMLKTSRSELLGTGDHEIFHGSYPSGSPHQADCCIVAAAMRTGRESTSGDQVFMAGDGSMFPVELAVGPVVEDDEITGAVVVFRDVSERRKIEMMKNEFVSMVSHELRTPLTSIRGSLGLLAGGTAGPMSPRGERMVTIALESSERLTRLIDDMLDIERIESGMIPVLLTDCHPADLIRKAVDAVRGIAGAHRIRIVVPEDVPEVRADSDRIVQTLTNLIGNAIKFSPPSTQITISAAEDESMVQFGVTDEGRGIPVDKLSRIFERFEQVDSTDARELGGSGLGLAISRTIVQRHGGDLSVTSRLGVGSTFTFTLPVAARGGPDPSVRAAELRQTV